MYMYAHVDAQVCICMSHVQSISLWSPIVRRFPSRRRAQLPPAVSTTTKMARKKGKGAAATSEQGGMAEEAPNPLSEDEEEEVSDEALAKIEARLQARMDARTEDIEAPASSAPTETVSLEPLEEDEDEPTFQSRLPALNSIPYADDAYGSLAPHAATAWQKVTEGVSKAREHTKEYEQTVAETIAPLSAAVAPHVAAGRALLGRVLQLPDLVLVEVDKEAGAELDVVLKTSLFTGRVVIDRISASSPAIGQIAAGDTIIEVTGRAPKHATHAASLIKRASALTLLVQPGKRRIAEVLGPEASDLAVLGRSRWRGVLCALACVWLLFSATSAPADWLRERSYRSQLARSKAALKLSSLSADSARHALGASRQSALVQMKQLLKLRADNASAHAEYDQLAAMYERMKAELTDEKARHKQEVARAKQDSSNSVTLKARQQAPRQ